MGPFTLRVLDTGAGHAHRLGAEGPRELAIPVLVAIALRPLTAAAVTDAAGKSSQFLLEHGFDRRPQAILDRVVSGLIGQCETAELSAIWFMARSPGGWLG